MASLSHQLRIRKSSTTWDQRCKHCSPLTTNLDLLNTHDMSTNLKDDVLSDIFQNVLQAYELSRGDEKTRGHPILASLQTCCHWKVCMHWSCGERWRSMLSHLQSVHLGALSSSSSPHPKPTWNEDPDYDDRESENTDGSQGRRMDEYYHPRGPRSTDSVWRRGSYRYVQYAQLTSSLRFAPRWQPL
jgi:hypothetical protein